MTNAKEFQARTENIEAMVQRAQQLTDEDARATALGLLQETMDLHAAVLGRMMELASPATAEQFARDPLISGLLVLYDLHPEDLDTRIARALEKVRPMLKSHGGNVELIGLNEGVLHLKLMGSCHGCSSSMATLKSAIEQAIYETAPEIATIIADGAVAAPEQKAGFVPLVTLQPAV
jgi:Fe-S cluster biogenesis protein NfuA